MGEKIVVSFDIGGTNLRGAVVALEAGGPRLLDQVRRATPNYLLGPDTPASERLSDVLGFIAEYFKASRERFGANALAAAFPGPIVGESTVLALPTVWGPDGQSLCPFDLGAMLAERLPGVPMKLMNDVTAAGYRFVDGSGDFALFTLGSAIGLKVFIDGVPRVGPHGYGGELTHMVFDPSPAAPRCDCGGQGHLGALASGRAWQRVSAAAKEAGGEPDLLAFVEPLSRAVAMLHYSLGLERFIFSGGLAEGLGELLRAAIAASAQGQGWQVGQDWNAMIELAPADDAHALIGGALAFATR